MVIRGGWFAIMHELNALNLKIICDTLTLVATFRVRGETPGFGSVHPRFWDLLSPNKNELLDLLDLDAPY